MPVEKGILPMVKAVERLYDRPIWWHILDASRNLIFPFAGFIGIIYFVQTDQYSRFDVLLFLFFFIATGIGITVGFHRLFSHRAFKAKQWLRLTLAVLGSFAWQRPLFVWVARHRLHHAHADQKGDFHSPYVRHDGTKITGTLNQFLHAHYTWLHWYDPIVDPESPLIKNIHSDSALRWIDRHYDFLTVASLLLPGILSTTFYGTTEGFIRGVIWGGLGRIFILLQVIWLIDSVTHKFGNKPYATRDGSTNFHVLDWITLGEGYHNNHHAFPSSPCFGFDKNQFDLGWLFIKGMEKLGQVYDLKAIPDARRRQFRKSGIGILKGLFS
jgi:stearoyl-CoA desaturase (delta-9 desaturase)